MQLSYRGAIYSHPPRFSTPEPAPPRSSQASPTFPVLPLDDLWGWGKLLIEPFVHFYHSKLSKGRIPVSYATRVRRMRVSALRNRSLQRSPVAGRTWSSSHRRNWIEDDSEAREDHCQMLQRQLQLAHAIGDRRQIQALEAELVAVGGGVWRRWSA